MKKIIKIIKIISFTLIFGVNTQAIHAEERIWVHTKYLGDYINSLCFYGGALPLTYHFRLYDDYGYYLEISPYSCIDISPVGPMCPRESSAWDIDEVTKVEPSYQEQLEQVGGVPAWYPVDIPDGFEPTSYRYGCSSNYATFQLTNPDDDISSSLTQTEVSQLYVCIFGRAAEGEGSLYWQTDPSSTSLTVTANIMLNTPTAKAYFGDTMVNNFEFVKHIYLNTFGKTYTDDPTGINYWTMELDAGKSKGELIHAIITAVQDPVNNDSGQARFFNRVEVSNYCAEKLYYFTDDATFTSFLSSVTDDPATVMAAKAAVDAF